MINDIAANDAAGLDDYLKALWRRKHFVVLLTIVGVILAGLYASSITREYTAQAQIVVGRLPNESSFVAQSLEVEQALLESNAYIDQVIAATGTSMSRADVQKQLAVSFVPDSGVLRIAFSAPDAQTAQALATAIATNYVINRTQTQTEFFAKQIVSLNEQASALTARIDPLTIELNELSTARLNVVQQPGWATSTALQDQANSLGILIQNKTTEQLTLIGQRAQVLDRVSNLLADSSTAPPPAQLTRSARTPLVPDGLSDKVLYAIGLIAGLLAGGAVALFLDRFDGTVRGERDVEAILGAPVLATVPSFPRNSATNGLVMLRATSGRRPAAARDSYRRLRSTLDFLAKRSDLKTFLVTSPRPGDGKSTTAVNLAIAAAQTGRKIAIVSADMHRPSLERLLSLPPAAGLSDYLLDESEAILTEVPGIPNLTAVTSGRPVETPAELLASSRVSELVKLLEENHDLVFFDTPPVLNASDSLALASRVDGVIVVIDTRSTESSDLEQLRDEMQLVGARIIGAVLNYHRLGMKRNTYAYGPTRQLAES
ncbi:MAG TPA: polysaccharide biosynthesis tyrosine autokinase [Acidimicrobiales bacterium]|nr:polysaccharide biosynthesis tyrosine autokinase [Acidimicrobiales bacterium]